MNDWGTPDWQDAAAYGDVTGWTFNRWRWEFYRRRDDLREYFDAHAEKTYQHWQKFAGKPGFPAAHLRPHEPGFCAMVSEEALNAFSYPALPNPRIGEQPVWAISPNAPEDSTLTHVSEHAPEGFHRIDFDLSKPLEPQLAHARDILRWHQGDIHGKRLQKRRHPSRWLEYLRTLDAREAMPGASWQELTDALFRADLVERHKDPAGGYRPPPHTAGRDKWEAGSALRFNF